MYRCNREVCGKMKTKTTEVKKMNIDIANRLYEMRKKSGLSQEELAEKIGVSRQAVSKWERAEASPDTDNLILLAKLYSLSLDDLLSTEEPIEPAEPAPQQPNAVREDFRENEEPHDNWLAFPYPLVVTVIYLILGFSFDLWHPAWVLFITIPIFYSIAGYSRHRRHRRW
jgi:transcriptional regulator with XRE-family HTH domain